MDYEKPKVLDYGDLAALTAKASTGTTTDLDFASGTPFGDLTFST